MASLHISMPLAMRRFIAQRLKETNQATPTEYLRTLILEDQKRAEKERLERMLVEGIDSEKRQATPRYLQQLRRQVRQSITSVGRPRGRA